MNLPQSDGRPNHYEKMQRNLVIAVIIIILFVLLFLFGILIWWTQNSLGRRGGNSVSDEENR